MPTPRCSTTSSRTRSPAATPSRSPDAGNSRRQLCAADQHRRGRHPGPELAASWAFAPARTLSANYTYTDSEQKSGDNKGEPLTNTPEHLANAKLNWQTTDRLNLWLKSEYRGERARFTSSYENLANANGTYSTNQSIYDTLGKNTKAYTLFHLGGSFRASENLTFNAAIYNLLNKDFVDGKAYTTYSAPTQVAPVARGEWHRLWHRLLPLHCRHYRGDGRRPPSVAIRQLHLLTAERRRAGWTRLRCFRYSLTAKTRMYAVCNL